MARAQHFRSQRGLAAAVPSEPGFAAAVPLERGFATPARFGDRRRMRIGLLGGSFNPAHGGHAHIARVALRALRLDQVWLLVSPGNPLKPQAGMAPLAARLASARAIGDGRRVIATAIEAQLGTRFTADTLRALRRRFPRARFVWLMGADNLAQLPRWQRWQAIARGTRVAVLPRPGYNFAARAGLAAKRLRHARLRGHHAQRLVSVAPPAWVFLTARQDARSSSAIRALQQNGPAGRSRAARPQTAAGKESSHRP